VDGTSAYHRVRTIEALKAQLRSVPGVKAGRGSGKPLSDRSLAKLLTLLGTVFRFAQRQELMDGNPAALVRKPKAVSHQPYLLDGAEIQRLREALDVPWQRLPVELTITTGLRSGELRALTWDNIDLEGSRLHVAQSMTRRGEAGATKSETSVRTVPLPGYLVPDLKRWRLACPLARAGYMFPGEPNAPGERAAIQADVLLRHILRRALRKAGLPELRFHDLRHMAASFMVEAGVPISRAQEILGHASERTTLRVYAHTLRRQHDDTADKIARLAGLSPPTDEPGHKRGTIDDLESRKVSQLVDMLAPRVGLEPTTNGLTVRRSTD